MGRRATGSKQGERPVNKNDRVLTLEEIRNIPADHYPLICYCDGGSLFSLLIRLFDKSDRSHMQALIGPDEIASQGWTFTSFPVSHMAKYATKFIWNPDWTVSERALMIASVRMRLALPWWKRLYDVPGVIGEALKITWLQLPWFDFCSEAMANRMLGLVDPKFRQWLLQHPSPTPREINQWTKAHNPPYKVYGWYIPDDDPARV